MYIFSSPMIVKSETTAYGGTCLVQDFWYIGLSIGEFSCTKLYSSELPMLLARLSSGDVTVRPRDLAVERG
jgi:hypothetical protein